MVRLKLQRIGKKKEPHFRLIVQEKSKDPHDRSVEILGWLNPRTKEKELQKDRIKYWLSVGAQPTDSVHNLLVSEGLLQADKKKTFKISKKRKAKMEGKKDDSAKPAAVDEAKTTEQSTKRVSVEEPKEEVKESQSVPEVKEPAEQPAPEKSAEIKTDQPTPEPTEDKKEDK